MPGKRPSRRPRPVYTRSTLTQREDGRWQIVMTEAKSRRRYQKTENDPTEANRLAWEKLLDDAGIKKTRKGR